MKAPRLTSGVGVLTALSLTACGGLWPTSRAAVPAGCEHPPRTQAELDSLAKRCPGIQVRSTYSARISDDGQYLEVTACRGRDCGDFRPYRIPLSEIPRDSQGRLMVRIEGKIGQGARLLPPGEQRP